MADPIKRKPNGQFEKGNNGLKSQLNNSGRDEALRLSRLGLGMKAIRKEMGNAVTIRRIRRWRKEAGLPTEMGNRPESQRRIRVDAWSKNPKWAFLNEQKAHRIGDESSHWSNHPEAIAYEVRSRNASQRDYYHSNKGRIYQNIKSNPQRLIKLRLRSRIHHVLFGAKKSQPTLELLGCSLEFLKSRLESQFKPGMSWGNYGLRGWHIDHIRPCASFDLTDPEQQKVCFHYTNLQPLWAAENWSKHARLV